MKKKHSKTVHYKLLLFSMISLLLSFSLHGQAPSGAVFKAGSGQSNITPFLGGGIVGNFGNPPKSVFIHDELYARSLVLDDGNNKMVFVVVDNISLNRDVLDAAKNLITERFDIPYANIMISCTHTHSSVSGGGEGEKRRGWKNEYASDFDEYQSFMVRRVADAVQNALHTIQPAEIAWGVCAVPQHVFNRRWLMKEKVVNPFGEQDQVQFNPGVNNPNKDRSAGPIDPDVSFLVLRSLEDKKPIGLLANYSLHYIGGLPSNHISADYFGVFSQEMKKIMQAEGADNSFIAMLSNGTSGNINNVDFTGKSKTGYPPYKKMDVVAIDVAQEIKKAYDKLQFQHWVPIRSEVSELDLKVRRASPKLIEDFENILADKKEAPHPLSKTYAERLFQMEKEWPDQITIPLQVVGLGDLSIAAIPFEVFVETGLELKQNALFSSTFTIGLANGSYGYLPTPEQHKLGGYETWLTTNRVQKDASVLIVNRIMEMNKRLK